MIKKEKFNIEYVFDKASLTNLWNFISTPSGLSEWFADDVSMDGNIYGFTWDGHSTKAEIIGTNPGNYIRFRWLEDKDLPVYFEFRLHKIELTGGIMLEITDFAEEEEKEDVMNLWESEVKVLKRILGL